MFKKLLKKVIKRRRFLVVRAEHMNNVLSMVNAYIKPGADLEVYQNMEPHPSWDINFDLNDERWEKLVNDLKTGKFGMVKTSYFYVGMLDDVVGV